ncbi:MAG: MoaD/ThiS family protein [Acidobacteriota bacterium]
MGDRSGARADLLTGAGLGLAALGVVAGAWFGGLRPEPGGNNQRPTTELALNPAKSATNGETILVTVSTFGSLRSIIGGASTKVSMAAGSTVADLSDHLADVYPALAPSAMLSVDDSSAMLPLSYVLEDGQSVTLIGSMAGG